MALNAGELNDRITFERKVKTTNSFGEEEFTWEPVAEVGDNGKVWAKRTNQLNATTEAVASGATAYREQVRWDIRPRFVDPQWRIVARGVAYDIRSVATSNDRSETAIIAVSGVNDG